ncbi:unnamed protein product [Parascedosporium putredinis]|uniref:Transcriptional regulatory protein RXT2 N-terminal domain-containing protein n=1 Tax=Parascedosporium putredinis TaxID=1442378 RepID=A0A9P1H7R9_9PEZI|nr:unnamed protein product [Parascedosporium putredinis]CAI7999983.1 unnamed protein product [Parascedosporium putredinis]
MASQQVLFAETIASLKRNLKRKTYESDSDDFIDHNGNRGQKLKKRARFTRQGQLAPPTGPEVYREEVDYAGTRRNIISRNPPFVDDDGFEVYSEDEMDERFQDALANAIDTNPYANVHIEHILAPLTSVTDLANHPALAAAYNSRSLTQLANQASELARKEQHALSEVKKLITGFYGDYTWIPCGLLVGPNDIDLYRDDSARLLGTCHSQRRQKVTVNGTPNPTGATLTKESGVRTTVVEDVAMTDREGAHEGPNNTDRSLNDEGKEGQDGRQNLTSDKSGAGDSAETSSKAKPASKPSEALPDAEGAANADTVPNKSKTKAANPAVRNGDSSSLQPTSEPSQTQTSTNPDSDEFPVHPFFTPPSYPRADRDMGLPENEADNVRQLLSHYVQKQEEVCRGALKLYFNLLKADRLRHQVLKWSKAEGHVGELSDGEDCRMQPATLRIVL